MPALSARKPPFGEIKMFAYMAILGSLVTMSVVSFVAAAMAG